MIAKTDLAYAAGIVDGEGCITILADPQIRPRVIVGTSDLIIVPWLRDTFGGNVQLVKRARLHPETSDHLRWYQTGRTAINFLKQLMPYLKLKKRHAELVVALEPYIKMHGGHTKLRELSDDDKFHRERLRQEVLQLNRKGTLSLIA